MPDRMTPSKLTNAVCIPCKAVTPHHNGECIPCIRKYIRENCTNEVPGGPSAGQCFGSCDMCLNDFFGSALATSDDPRWVSGEYSVPIEDYDWSGAYLHLACPSYDFPDAIAATSTKIGSVADADAMFAGFCEGLDAQRNGTKISLLPYTDEALNAWWSDGVSLAFKHYRDNPVTFTRKAFSEAQSLASA